MPTRTTGAARWYTEVQLGGPTREAESSVNVQNTTTLIVGNNGDRVNLVMINEGAFDVFVQQNPTGAPTTGIKLSAQGGSVTMTVRDDYTLPSRAYFGISGGGASLVYVIETIADITLAVEQV